MYLFVFEV